MYILGSQRGGPVVSYDRLKPPYKKTLSSEELQPCSFCNTTDFTWKRNGRWMTCEDCNAWVCGSCVDKGGVKDGPSGQDYCKDCIGKYPCDEGFRICINCQINVPDNMVRGCEDCSRYFCPECEKKMIDDDTGVCKSCDAFSE